MPFGRWASRRPTHDAYGHAAAKDALPVTSRRISKGRAMTCVSGQGFVRTVIALFLWFPVAHTTDAATPRGLIDALEVQTLSQNWNDAEAKGFYNLPQGSKLLPYEWFLALEQQDSDKAFLDADHIRGLGYLPRSAEPSGNPDGLPIGFVKDGANLGLTCAACHTTQINFQGKGWLIDGAPTLGDFETFLRRLLTAMEQTNADEVKFQRFANRLLGSGATDAARVELRNKLQKEISLRKAYNERNLPPAGAAPFGPGRVDAFGAIMNEVTTRFAGVPANAAFADAPVSYPFLWDTPQHDFVQWNGAAENSESVVLGGIIGTRHAGALGRNVGEVLGVFGDVDATDEGSILQLRGYPSSVRKSRLVQVEELIRNLWSPQWPAELGAIDPQQRDLGRTLFKDHCRRCHDDLSFRRDDPNRVVKAAMSDVGTDRSMAYNFASRTAKSGIFKGRRVDLTGFRTIKDSEPVKDLLLHTVQRVIVFPQSNLAPFDAAAQPLELLANLEPNLRYVIHADIKVGDRTISGEFDRIDFSDGRVSELFSRNALRVSEKGKFFRQNLSSPKGALFQADNDEVIDSSNMAGLQFDVTAAGATVTFAQPEQVALKYKGRPLNGIWATAPYLHNGSVPTLDDLLKPPGQRPTTFKLGSREFDPARVGFVNQGDFEFDTSLPGNSNSGHEYDRVFTDQERHQLVEYMKSL